MADESSQPSQAVPPNVQQEENESFVVGVGRSARSSLNLIVLLALAFAVGKVAQLTGQAGEGWVKFLIDKTTFFAVWGIVVVAGFEFLKVCFEAGYSFIGRVKQLHAQHWSNTTTTTQGKGDNEKIST